MNKARMTEEVQECLARGWPTVTMHNPNDSAIVTEIDLRVSFTADRYNVECPLEAIMLSIAALPHVRWVSLTGPRHDSAYTTWEGKDE